MIQASTVFDIGDDLQAGCERLDAVERGFVGGHLVLEKVHLLPESSVLDLKLAVLSDFAHDVPIVKKQDAPDENDKGQRYCSTSAKPGGKHDPTNLRGFFGNDQDGKITVPRAHRLIYSHHDGSDVVFAAVFVGARDEPIDCCRLIGIVFQNACDLFVLDHSAQSVRTHDVAVTLRGLDRIDVRHHVALKTHAAVMTFFIAIGFDLLARDQPCAASLERANDREEVTCSKDPLR